MSTQSHPRPCQPTYNRSKKCPTAHVISRVVDLVKQITSVVVMERYFPDTSLRGVTTIFGTIRCNFHDLGRIVPPYERSCGSYDHSVVGPSPATRIKHCSRCMTVLNMMATSMIECSKLIMVSQQDFCPAVCLTMFPPTRRCVYCVAFVSLFKLRYTRDSHVTHPGGEPSISVYFCVLSFCFHVFYVLSFTLKRDSTSWHFEYTVKQTIPVEYSTKTTPKYQIQERSYLVRNTSRFGMQPLSLIHI